MPALPIRDPVSHVVRLYNAGMRILALDTSTEYLSLALYLDGEIICRESHAGIRHSELILPMLEVLLVEAE